MLHQIDNNAKNCTFESLPVYIGDEHGKLALEFNKFLKTISTQSEQLKQERERYRSLFETSPDAIFLLLGITLIDCNPATSIIFAGDKKELIGRTILDLSPPVQVHDESSSSLVEKITQQSTQQNLQTFDWIHKTIDGRLFKAEVRLKPFGTVNNEPLMVAFVRDITEQKKVEESLRLTQFSFDKASFGIFRSGSKGQILNVNEQACRSLGYTNEELCRMSVFDIDPSISSESWDDLWQKRLKEGSISFESCHRSRDGRTFPVQITSSVFEYEGIYHSIAFVRDITEEKEREKEKAIMESNFRHAQRMEALGTLAGGIAHDFNNILSAIMGYTELTQLESLGNLKIQSYLSHLQEAGNRAKHLVQQILSFTRQGVSEKHPIDIRKVVGEALNLIRATVPSTIEIFQNIGENIGIVFADETQIHQVVMNLCTNSYQAMKKEGGRLEVDLLPVIITDKDALNYPDMNPGPYLKLAITDTGCGMEPDKVSKIFDPYFTTKPVGEGTGLGLSTVHGIIKDHGGIIKVYSELDKGTTFQIFLPVADAEAYHSIISEGPLPKGNETILYVDDEKFILDVGNELLTGLGYAVETRASSIDAYEAFRINPMKYDLVISDMTMPKLTGANLALKILEIRPDMPMILCTGFSTRLNADRLKKIGVKTILMKPVTLNELAVTVRRVLDEGKRETILNLGSVL
jgi:two-component system, cell cycle sensor histidine kinase and response regulator CckA